jgi:hypothetical protein
MLLNVADLTEDQLKNIGLPPNPAGWNCFDTKSEQYCDAIWAHDFDPTHNSWFAICQKYVSK